MFTKPMQNECVWSD